MDDMQGSMPVHMSIQMKDPVYWRKDQIAITFPSHLKPGASSTEINDVVNKNLSTLSAHTRTLKDTPFTLKRLSNKNDQDDENDPANNLTGISIYAAPTYAADKVPTLHITGFFSIHKVSDSMAGNNPGETARKAIDILEAVRKLNDYERSGQAQFAFQATPHWLWSGVADEDPTHGCPVTPPFPVEDGGRRGQWKTRFPMLPDALEDATGAGVTVFILDAFPDPEQLLLATNGAGEQNTLLQQMALGMVSREPFQAEPPAIGLNTTYAVPGPVETAVTGKDIYGRLSGFRMADHGTFIAGLVRDVAPDASIECVRVLNDFAVGDSATLTQALADIEARLSAGDLRGQRVVINLSLVIGPPECDLERLGLTPAEVLSLLTPLHTLMLSMSQQGAIFVAAAGNDSDPRDFSMNLSEMRFNARYPAAFGNDLSSIDPSFTPLRAVIPAGAVNRRGEPAAYSNYPGPNGIATYGGDLPRPEHWLPSASGHAITHVDPNFPIDALRGVYSAQTYPALSRNDPYPALGVTTPNTPRPYPRYPATETSAWAYWSGTSFAAPIISGLAARVLENPLTPSDGASVYAALVATSQQTTWTATETPGDVFGPMVITTQEWEDEE